MWFAALGTYNRNIWFLRLLEKLTEPNSTEVYDLLEVSESSFKIQIDVPERSFPLRQATEVYQSRFI